MIVDVGTILFQLKSTVIASILMEWYTTQKACVRWGSAVSDSFIVKNVVRQGGILSPLLFNVYMDGLSSSLSNTPTGCWTLAGRMCSLWPNP